MSLNHTPGELVAVTLPAGVQAVNGLSVPNALIWYNRHGYAAYPASATGKMLAIPRGYKFDELGVLGIADPGAVYDTWRRQPNLRVALIMGQASGLVAIDVDDLDQWEKFCAEHGDKLPPTAWQTTGREGGGFHLLYRRGDLDPALLRQASWPDFPAIELKTKAPLIAAPSRHASGRLYQWQQGPGGPAQITDDLLAGFREGERRLRATVRAMVQEVNMDERLPIPASNPADFADLLCWRLGTGCFTGVFQRDNKLVTVPRFGEKGYMPVKDSDEHPEKNPPAQIRPLTEKLLQGFIASRAWTYKLIKTGPGPHDFERVHILPPLAACGAVISSDPARWESVPVLSGVIHVPLLRRDGSLLQQPGYDEPTGLLYLPLPGQAPVVVPEQPSAEDASAAAGRLWSLFCDFGWVSTADYLNYLAAVLVPPLRLVIPPPWPPWFISAHERGSGKTLLCEVPRILHGGVLFAAPEGDRHGDEEIRKLIFSILSTTTGAVVILDNAMQAVRSRHFASMFTSPDGMLHDRKLGVSESPGLPNDRAWMFNGNNLRAGGDLPRRALWASIDPQVPQPWLRTSFQISDLAGHVTANRSAILADILTLGRHWALCGFPAGPASRGDSFARFETAMSGLMQSAGMPGEQFWSAETSRAGDGADDEDWAAFLAAVHGQWGDARWEARQLITACQSGTGEAIRDALPGDLAMRLAKGDPAASVAKSLGWWLANHEGQWTSGRYAVRQAGGGKDGHPKVWRVEHRA